MLGACVAGVFAVSFGPFVIAGRLRQVRLQEPVAVIHLKHRALACREFVVVVVVRFQVLCTTDHFSSPSVACLLTGPVHACCPPSASTANKLPVQRDTPVQCRVLF